MNSNEEVESRDSSIFMQHDLSSSLKNQPQKSEEKESELASIRSSARYLRTSILSPLTARPSPDTVSLRRFRVSNVSPRHTSPRPTDKNMIYPTRKSSHREKLTKWALASARFMKKGTKSGDAMRENLCGWMQRSERVIQDHDSFNQHFLEACKRHHTHVHTTKGTLEVKICSSKRFLIYLSISSEIFR
jgi:hypothetical protein